MRFLQLLLFVSLSLMSCYQEDESSITKLQCLKNCTINYYPQEPDLSNSDCGDFTISSWNTEDQFFTICYEDEKIDIQGLRWINSYGEDIKIWRRSPVENCITLWWWDDNDFERLSENGFSLQLLVKVDCELDSSIGIE